MAEALNSVYKDELIDCHGGDGLVDVMVATSSWLDWRTSRRLQSVVGNRPPREVRDAMKMPAPGFVLAA